MAESKLAGPIKLCNNSYYNLFSVVFVLSMLGLGHILISDLVVANLLMYSLPVMILLYLAVPFFTPKVFWMRYHHFCKDKYFIVTQIKHK